MGSVKVFRDENDAFEYAEKVTKTYIDRNFFHEGLKGKALSMVDESLAHAKEELRKEKEEENQGDGKATS